MLYCRSGEGLFAEGFEHLGRVLKDDQGLPWCMGESAFRVGHICQLSGGGEWGWREPAMAKRGWWEKDLGGGHGSRRVPLWVGIVRGLGSML